MLLIGYVKAVSGEMEGGIRLAVFAIAVRELAHEMSFVTSLGPGLAQIQANRAG